MPEDDTPSNSTRLLLKTLLPVYGIIVVMLVGALWYVDSENDQQDKERQESINRFIDEQVSDCEDQNQSEEVLRRAIEISTAQAEGGSSFDLTTIDGFSNLDPATQEWVRNFNDLIAQGGGGGVQKQLQEFAETTLVPEDCEQIRADFEKQQDDS